MIDGLEDLKKSMVIEFEKNFMQGYKEGGVSALKTIKKVIEKCDPNYFTKPNIMRAIEMILEEIKEFKNETNN